MMNEWNENNYIILYKENGVNKWIKALSEDEVQKFIETNGLCIEDVQIVCPRASYTALEAENSELSAKLMLIQAVLDGKRV